MRICWFKACVGLNAHLKKSCHTKKKKQLFIRTFLSQFQACFILREGKKPQTKPTCSKKPQPYNSLLA